MKSLENIQILQQFNREFAEEAGCSTDEVRSYGMQLKSYEIELQRINAARGVKPAVGIFGQSQCGKSYLVSELTGGLECNLTIKGLEEKNIMDYNQRNAAKESTALVTRITSDKYSDSAYPKKHALIKYMNPYEVMWSFVIGFYGELKFGKFKLSDDKIKDIKAKIKNDDKSESLPNSISFVAEFNDCVKWIEGRVMKPHELAYTALEYLDRSSVLEENFGIEKFVLLASTLWNCDKNITNAFKARIKTLQFLNFRTEGYLPESLLKDALSASTLKTLTLKFNKNQIPTDNHGILLSSGNPDSDIERLGNIQTIIKEVVLPVELKENKALLNYMDVLDFPGARALKGLEGADPDTISNDIKDNSSVILKDVYKRGKLLYLFETYKKGFDITLLLFCSENQPAEVPVLRTMIQSWINIDPKQKPEDTSLFSVFTKADMMIMQKDTVEDADVRITARFKENFSDYYGSWIDNYNETDKPFQNFYFVRNPQATNSSFTKVKGQYQLRRGFEKPRELLFKAFNDNEYAKKYLGSEMQTLLNEVFEPEKTGIENLKSKIISRFLMDPDKKTAILDANKKRIIDFCKYYKKQFLDDNKAVVDERERDEALKFVFQLRKSVAALPKILNTISDNCPSPSYLNNIINTVLDKAVAAGGIAIAAPKPLKEGMPTFIQSWLDRCKDMQLHEDNAFTETKLEAFQLDKFFDTLQKYLTNDSFLNELVEDFSSLFNIQEDIANNIIIRNYLLWIVGEKIYYLESEDTNSTPSEPVKIPEVLDFKDYVLEIWEKQLPEIYAKNYSMRKSGKGEKLLKQVTFS